MRTTRENPHREQFRSLQRLRGSHVHFIAKPMTPVAHPELPTNTSPENVAFSVEAAGEAIEMLIGILDLATHVDDVERRNPSVGRCPPRARHPAGESSAL